MQGEKNGEWKPQTVYREEKNRTPMREKEEAGENECKRSLRQDVVSEEVEIRDGWGRWDVLR